MSEQALVTMPPANARQVVPNNHNNGHALTEVPSQPIGSLATALASARDKCKTANKDAYNKHHEFWYASADEVIDTAKAALEGSGISPPIPISTKLTVLGTGSSAIYALDRVFLLAHASGESILLTVEGWPVMPERGRPLDKAFPIALTTSLAYLLRDLLLMRRGDPSDDVSSQDDRQTPVQRQPRQESQQQAPPANPTEAPQESGSLTEEEYAALVALARENHRTQNDVLVICAVMGVKTLDRAPRGRLKWLQKALTTGLTPATIVDRLGGLIDALSMDWATTVPSKLRATYGVTSLAHLLPEQAEELENKLKATLSAKMQQAKEAAAPAA